MIRSIILNLKVELLAIAYFLILMSCSEKETLEQKFF